MQLSQKRVAYSVYFFFYIGFLAFGMGYFPLWCQKLGFQPWQIAAIAASENIASLIGPTWLRRKLYSVFNTPCLLAGAVSVSLISFVNIFWIKTFLVLIICWFIVVLANNIHYSLVIAASVQDDHDEVVSFSRVRLWGSIGFVVFSFIIGLVDDYFGPIWVVVASLTVLFCFLFYVHRSRELLWPRFVQNDNEDDFHFSYLWTGKVPRKILILFLLVVMSWSSHAVFYTFFTVHLRTLGWSATAVAWAWSVGVVAECLMLIFFNILAARMSLERIVVLSMGISIVRWLIMLTMTNGALIFCAQALHAFSFASLYVATTKLGTQWATGELQKEIQGLLLAAGPGIGVLSGRIIAGGASLLLADKTNVQPLFAISVVTTIVAMAIAVRSLKPEGARQSI